MDRGARVLPDQARERERERAGADGERLDRLRRAADEREAELRSAMRDGEARLRDRIARLDADNQDLRRCACHNCVVASPFAEGPLEESKLWLQSQGPDRGFPVDSRTHPTSGPNFSDRTALHAA